MVLEKRKMNNIINTQIYTSDLQRIITHITILLTGILQTDKNKFD